MFTAIESKRKKGFKAVFVFPSRAVCDFHFVGDFRFSFIHYQADKTQRLLILIRIFTNSYSSSLTSPPDINLRKQLAAFSSINMLVLSLDWRMHVTMYVCCSPSLQQRNWRGEGKERKFLTCSSAFLYLFCQKNRKLG